MHTDKNGVRSEEEEEEDLFYLTKYLCKSLS